MSLPALFLCALAVASQDDPASWRDRSEGTPAGTWDRLERKPFQSLTDLDGWYNTDPLTWDALRGHVVLIQHFATTRRSAVGDVPVLVDLFHAHADEGFVVLTVHAKRQAASFERFVIRHGVPYAVAVDLDGKFARRAGAKKVPVYHLVGRDGRVRVAGLRAEETVLAEAVRAALAEPWEGERDEITYAQRIWTDWRAKPTPPLTVGPGGWPNTPSKTLYAKKDVRGKLAPTHGESHWVTEAVEVHGRPHLYLVWGTHISTCFASLGRMQELHERFGAHLVVLGVSEQAPDKYTRGESRPWGDTVKDYLVTRPGLTYANVLDGERYLKDALGVIGMPHALLVDSAGIGRWQGDPMSGDFPLTDAIVRRTLAIDRLTVGEAWLGQDGEALQLLSGPPGLRGILCALPARLPLLGGYLLCARDARPTPLHPTEPVGDDGGLLVAGPLPDGLGPASLAWLPRRPDRYEGALPWAVGR